MSLLSEISAEFTFVYKELFIRVETDDGYHPEFKRENCAFVISKRAFKHNEGSG